MGFSPEKQDGSTQAKQSILYTTLVKWRIEIHDHLNRCRKSIWQNLTSIYKNSQQSEYRGKIPQHNKYYDKPTVNLIFKEWKPDLLRSGTKPGHTLSSLLFNSVLAVLAVAIREEKEIKEI